MNLQPRRPPGRADEPFRHLIDEYKHRAQTVTCTCGWHGSSASPDGRTSEWKEHLAATRVPPSPVAKTPPTNMAPRGAASGAATRAATSAPTGPATTAPTRAPAAASAKASG